MARSDYFPTALRKLQAAAYMDARAMGCEAEFPYTLPTAGCFERVADCFGQFVSAIEITNDDALFIGRARLGYPIIKRLSEMTTSEIKNVI